MIEQWGVIPEGRTNTKVNILSYSSPSNYAVVLGGQSYNTAYHYNKNNNYFYVNISDYLDEIDWLTIGY